MNLNHSLPQHLKLMKTSSIPYQSKFVWRCCFSKLNCAIWDICSIRFDPPPSLGTRAVFSGEAGKLIPRPIVYMKLLTDQMVCRLHFCRFYGLQTVWSAEFMVCRLNGLHIVWSGGCMACSLYDRIVCSLDCVACRLYDKIVVNFWHFGTNGKLLFGRYIRHRPIALGNLLPRPFYKINRSVGTLGQLGEYLTPSLLTLLVTHTTLYVGFHHCWNIQNEDMSNDTW